MEQTHTPIGYTIADASKVSGFARTKLYELIGDGALDARKAGRRTIIMAASLQTFMAALPAASIRAPRPKIAA